MIGTMNSRKSVSIVSGVSPLITLTLILTSLVGQTQNLDKNYYAKIELSELTKREVVVDSLKIDTLLMQRGSKLVFANVTKIIIDHAFIGNNCQFDASGVDGIAGKSVNPDKIPQGSKGLHGTNGANGKNLSVTIVFEELGSLTINTSGGNGGKGANGFYGGNGKTFGNAGNGGNLSLFYFCNGFTPRLEVTPEAKLIHNRLLLLLHKAGKEGAGGKGGSGWSEYGFDNQANFGRKT